MSSLATPSPVMPLAAALEALPARPAVQWRDEALRCSDGRLLSARWAEPATGRPTRGVAVIGPATAVAARYYVPFCEWLAARGYAVLSFDYRGIGASREALRPGEDVAMRDWALLDMAAAMRVATRRRDVEHETHGHDLGLLWIGHSFGGNAIGLVPGFERLDAVLGVAAQIAYWRFWQGWAKVQAWTFFHLVLPTVATLFGRAPGRLLGPRAEDLPAGAAYEWSRWGRMPEFHFSDESLAAVRRFDRFTGSVHLWSISDDHLFGPKAAVDAFGEKFTAAQVVRHHLVPEDVGAKRIEHFGAFKRDMGPRLWERLVAPVEATTPRLRGQTGA